MENKKRKCNNDNDNQQILSKLMKTMTLEDNKIDIILGLIKNLEKRFDQLEKKILNNSLPESKTYYKKIKLDFEDVKKCDFEDVKKCDLSKIDEVPPWSYIS